MTTPATTTTNGAAPTGAASALPEAPAAASVKVCDPDGREWILTLRTTTAAELLSRVVFLGEWLTSHQWTPAASKPSTSTTAAAGDPPICPTHKRPMQRGRRGWFCSARIADDDGTGKPAFCRQTA